MTRPLYQALASKVAARINCDKTDKADWSFRHKTDADKLVHDLMPSGSGFDSGTTLNWDKSTMDKLVFDTSFHHMDVNGYYDGWTEHEVTVTGSLMFGIALKVGGRDRNTIKDHIHEAFHFSLTQPEPAEVVANA